MFPTVRTAGRFVPWESASLPGKGNGSAPRSAFSPSGKEILAGRDLWTSTGSRSRRCDNAARIMKPAVVGHSSTVSVSGNAAGGRPGGVCGFAQHHAQIHERANRFLVIGDDRHVDVIII